MNYIHIRALRSSLGFSAVSLLTRNKIGAQFSYVIYLLLLLIHQHKKIYYCSSRLEGYHRISTTYRICQLKGRLCAT